MLPGTNWKTESRRLGEVMSQYGKFINLNILTKEYDSD